MTDIPTILMKTDVDGHPWPPYFAHLAELAKGWKSDPTGDPDRVEPLADGVLTRLVRVRELEEALGGALNMASDMWRQDPLYAALRSLLAKEKP